MDRLHKRGYIVRIETKQGGVYRPKTLAALDGQDDQPGQANQPGQADQADQLDQEQPTPTRAARRLVASAARHQRYRCRFPVAPHGVAALRGSPPALSVPPPTKRKGRRGDDAIAHGIDLARSGVPLPGERGTPTAVSCRPAHEAAHEARQDAELYRRGILYEAAGRDRTGPAPGSTSSGAPMAASAETAAAAAAAAASAAASSGPSTSIASTATSTYHADSLAGIQHAEPSYTVRLVDKKRKGKKAGTAASSTATLTPLDHGHGEEDEDEARLIRELPVPEGLRLFTLGHLWEEETGDGDDVHRLLGHQDICFDDIEHVEYVLIDDDDLHSMAASWVELDSVADSDGWT